MTLLKVDNRLLVNLKIGFYNNKKMKIIKIILVVLALNFSSSVFAEISYTQFENGDSYEGNWVNSNMSD